jgi:hypothetical protein
MHFLEWKEGVQHKEFLPRTGTTFSFVAPEKLLPSENGWSNS